jgi:hypothetical protein
MGLWGNTAAAASRPKNYSEDGNASGNNGALKDIVTNAGGWALAPGLAASGNDNTDASPEILIAISGLQAGTIGGSVNVRSIGWTDGAYADAATFDLTVNFEEPVDITSAAWSADQVVTNKAYILLSRIGATDGVEDNTIAAQYYSGTGTNELTFRGTLQAAGAGYIGFNGEGVGDDSALLTGISFAGTSALDREDGTAVLGLKQEGTASTDGQDALILNSSAGGVMTTNGAVAASTTIVVDGVTSVASTTIAVGQVVTVKDTSTASISDALSATGISTDNTLTITAVASQTQFTVSEAVTIATNIDLLFETNGGDEILADAIDFTVAGEAVTTSDITAVTKTGGDTEIFIGILEDGTDDHDLGEDTIIMNASDGSASDDGDRFLSELGSTEIAVFEIAGTTSGTANVLNGVTTT